MRGHRFPLCALWLAAGMRCGALFGCEKGAELVPESTLLELSLFAPPPSCPAPNARGALSYQESGGSQNALLWYETMYSLARPPSQEPFPAVHPVDWPTAPLYRATYYRRYPVWTVHPSVANAPPLTVTTEVPPIPVVAPAHASGRTSARLKVSLSGRRAQRAGRGL